MRPLAADRKIPPISNNSILGRGPLPEMGRRLANVLSGVNKKLGLRANFSTAVDAEVRAFNKIAGAHVCR